MVRYQLTLTQDKHDQLKAILNKGSHSSLQFRNACILINTVEDQFEQKEAAGNITRLLHVNVKTVERLKKRFVEQTSGHPKSAAGQKAGWEKPGDYVLF